MRELLRGYGIFVYETEPGELFVGEEGQDQGIALHRQAAHDLAEALLEWLD